MAWHKKCQKVARTFSMDNILYGKVAGPQPASVWRLGSGLFMEKILYGYVSGGRVLSPPPQPASGSGGGSGRDFLWKRFFMAMSPAAECLAPPAAGFGLRRRLGPRSPDFSWKRYKSLQDSGASIKSVA